MQKWLVSRSEEKRIARVSNIRLSAFVPNTVVDRYPLCSTITHCTLMRVLSESVRPKWASAKDFVDDYIMPVNESGLNELNELVEALDSI